MRVITFGEIMGRLTPTGFLRLSQAMPGTLQVSFAGAEANVAASICRLGGEAALVTAVPENALGNACLASLRGQGVDTRYVATRNEGRLGLYFLETGANQRASQVVYDRAGSTVSLTTHDHYPFADIFADADWFHTSGITPAISAEAAESTLHAVKAAKSAGVTVSCDLNFRKKLWLWRPGTPQRELAEETMRKVLAHVDVVIANEEDCSDVLSIHASETNVESGQLAIDRYPEVARKLVSQLPNVQRVAITLRESISASHNNWGAMLFDAASDQSYFAPCAADGTYQPYEIRNIVDRVGAGDSFAAGLIFASLTARLEAPDQAIRFAAAASCLAHSVTGDFNDSSCAEVERLMGGAASGRVIR